MFYPKTCIKTTQLNAIENSLGHLGHLRLSGGNCPHWGWGGWGEGQGVCKWVG